MEYNQKITTDNIPLLDDILHYVKRLCTESVIKVQADADKYETQSISTMAYRYLCAVDDSADFYLYTYRRNEFIDAGVPLNIVDECYVDLQNVPTPYRAIMLRHKKEEQILMYQEVNPYYRTLNGTPIRNADYITLPAHMIPDGVHIEDLDAPVHLYSDIECDLLYHYGVIDELKSRYPEYKYLDYLGSKRISIYKARKSSNFSILYMPNDIPPEIVDRFKEKLSVNRAYIESVIYSEAYKFKSEYYDNFLCVLLLVLTMIDIIAEMPDMINKNEIFDLKMVKLIFENYGIDFFDTIPFHYQLAMIKNMHKLLKFKSTTLNIIDICSLFGFDNVKVFKYYLLKERKTDDETGRYVTGFDKNWVIDNTKTFDLKFVKVPITETISPYLNDRTKFIDYDTITNKDTLWDGGLDHEYVKKEILDLEFNHYYTKYISIDILNSMSELAFQLCYFYNIIFDDKRIEELLRVNIPTIRSSTGFKLLDILSLLYALGYRYNGVNDVILSKQTKVLHVMGFNFEADLNVLANDIEEKGYTLEDLGVADWMSPNEIITMNQLIEIYTNNKNIHYHLVDAMNNAENKRVYDVYKMVYDSLMITKYTAKVFTKANGDIAETYTDFIKDKDALLYKVLVEIDGIENISDRKVLISSYINDIVYSLSEYIDSDEIDDIFSIFPTVSKEAIRTYIKLVIEFFKSYTIDIESVNSIYKFDDKLNNKVRILDDMITGYLLRYKDIVDVYDKIKNAMFTDLHDQFTLKDFAHIIAIQIRDVFIDEFVDISDDISNIEVDFAFEDNMTFYEYVTRFTEVIYGSKFDIHDVFKIWSDQMYTETIKVNEKLIIFRIWFKSLYFMDDKFIDPVLSNRISKFTISDRVDIVDDDIGINI